MPRLVVNASTSTAFRGRNVAHALVAPWRTVEPSRFAVESIIGEDDRTFELSTTRLPGRLICALRVWRGSEVSNGTAWLAGPKLAITCAHCLHEIGKPPPDRVQLIPGLAEDIAPFGTINATAWEIAPGWRSANDWQWDIASVTFAEPIGDRLGWFGLRQIYGHEALAQQPIKVSGYPETDGRFDIQRVGTGRIAGISAGRLYHDADTSDGESGGPIWLSDRETSPPLVIGVHGKEAEPVAFEGFSNANSGVPFSGEVMALIAHWATKPG